MNKINKYLVSLDNIVYLNKLNENLIHFFNLRLCVSITSGLT